LTRMRSIGRGKSDWMIAVICKRVERDTASGGSELGDSVRRRPRANHTKIPTGYDIDFLRNCGADESTNQL
jgi:hypothetical protein